MADGFRRTLTRLLGRTPARAPLRAKLLERVRLPGIVREKVSYAVEPGERVSAYLFLPEGKGRRPAVLCIHQHHREFHLGKSEPAGLAGSSEQAYALELAGRGYVTLAPDLICFEERRHQKLSGVDYERFEAMRRLAGGSCLQAKMLWDLGRAVDYLIGRREVDGRRIGCLGHSLGGQETLFLSALDRRIAVGCRAAGSAATGRSSAQRSTTTSRRTCRGSPVTEISSESWRSRRPGRSSSWRGARIRSSPGGCPRDRPRREARVRTSEGPAAAEGVSGRHGFSVPMREAASSWFDRWLRPGGS